MPFPSLTKEQLETACAEWQKRLRVLDWDVDIEIVRWQDIEGQGRVIITQTLKHAYIKVRDGIDSPKDSRGDYDMEETLLHELLHIRFKEATEPGEYRLPEHQNIALEQALIQMVPWMMSVGRIIPIRDKDDAT